MAERTAENGGSHAKNVKISVRVRGEWLMVPCQKGEYWRARSRARASTAARLPGESGGKKAQVESIISYREKVAPSNFP